MAKWQIAQSNGVQLKRATVSEMLAPIRLSGGKPFNSVGLAWFRQVFRGHRLVLHNGSTIASYSSVIYWYLDDGPLGRRTDEHRSLEHGERARLPRSQLLRAGTRCQRPA